MNLNPTKAELKDASILLQLLMEERIADVGHYIRSLSSQEKDRMIVALLVTACAIEQKPAGFPLEKLLEILREEGAD